MREKRFSNITMGMISLVIGQVASAVGTVVLEGQISELSGRLDEVEVRSFQGQEQLGKEISQVAERVDMNSVFNQACQVMEVLSNDGRELHGVM